MRTQTWLCLFAAAAATATACTFGADDFKVVDSAKGGDNASSGGNTATAGKNATGGKNAVAGGDSNPDTGGAPDNSTAGNGPDLPTAGAGGAGQVPTMLTCATRGQKLTLFAATDLQGQPFDRFGLVNGGPTSAYAVVTAESPMSDALIAVRRVTDSMNSPVAELKVFTAMGHYTYGGAYFAGQAVHVIGADQRGVFDVTFTTSANGQLSAGAPVVTILNTPLGCGGPAMTVGSMRDMRAAYDDNLSYVVTCQSGNDTGFTLFLRNADSTIVPLGGMGNDASLIIRQYVHSKDGTMLLITGDEFGPTQDLRYGKTAMDLATVHQLKIDKTADPTLFQSSLLLPLSDGTGSFFLDSTIHDPSRGTVTPVTLYGAAFKTKDYPSLSLVPPPLFKQLAYYTKATDVVLPADGAVRANDILLAASDPLSTTSVYAWMVDLAGNQTSDRLAVYEKGGTVDDQRTVQVGAGFLVGWRETDTTASIAGRNIGCF